MFHQHENCEQKDLLDQENEATQTEPESHRRLNPRRPEKVVKLIAADVTDSKPEKSTIGLHSTERALAKIGGSLSDHARALAGWSEIRAPRRLTDRALSCVKQR